MPLFFTVICHFDDRPTETEFFSWSRNGLQNSVSFIVTLALTSLTKNRNFSEVNPSRLQLTIEDLPLSVEPMNRIWFSFTEPIAVSQIDLRLKDGPTLGWTVQWSADQQTVTLRPPNTCSILMNDETYVI